MVRIKRTLIVIQIIMDHLCNNSYQYVTRCTYITILGLFINCDFCSCYSNLFTNTTLCVFMFWYRQHQSGNEVSL